MTGAHGDVRLSGARDASHSTFKLATLVGSGHKIALFALPVLALGLALNIARPAWFGVGGPAPAVLLVASVTLGAGVVIWLWSAFLIVTRVPRGELITHGPYALLKHPLYTGVALLVLPSVGLLLDSWLGALVGLVMYIGSRRFSPEEERSLSETFGAAWDDYCKRVKIPWL
jgi:protein-S-isoprenylcysteine O-methyltransferase Ste14